jgi:peptidoglycan/xylan/chitin deacetylase (PgdA/CDA1 family)
MNLARGPVSLAYHGVNVVSSADDPVRLINDPATLAAHVRLLQRLRYRFVTAEHLIAGRGRVAALTFDDGLADGLEVAAPLLERLGAVGTFYVCPGWFGGSHPLVEGDAARLLDADGVRELQRRGMEIGSHTMTHEDLRLLSDAELDAQLRDSKGALEEVTGRPCRTLAYPYGLYDERVVAAAGRAGYELAFAWQPVRWHALSAPPACAYPTGCGASCAGCRMPEYIGSACPFAF